VRYVVTLLGITLLTLVLVSFANWLIDPFGRYWSPTITGFNEVKPASVNRVRVTKAYRAVEVAPEVVLVGNSRVEMGLDPRFSVFSASRVYNIAMPGASVGMQVDYALNTIYATGTVKRLIVGVDFLDFLERASFFDQPATDSEEPGYRRRLLHITAADFEKRWYSWREQASLIFSLDSFYAGLLTFASRNSNPSVIDEYGFNTAQDYVGIIRKEGVNALFVQKITELGANLSSAPRLIASHDGKRYSPSFDHLRRLLDETDKLGIEVTLFINPYHFSYLYLLADVGLIDEFWRWKVLLTQQLSERAVHAPVLWDFSIFSDPVLEPVPMDRPKTAMTWYWEPAHYRRELGDRMLEVMLGDVESELAIRLDQTTVEGVILQGKKDLKLSRARWLALTAGLGLAPVSPPH